MLLSATLSHPRKLPVSRLCKYALLLLPALLWYCVPATGQDADIAVYLRKARDAGNSKQNDSAIYYADKVIALSKKTKDTMARVRVMRTKGKSLLAMQQEKEALDIYFEAMRLCRTPAYDREAAMLCGEIAYYYYMRGNGREAKEYYRRNIDMMKSISGLDSMGNQLINLSVTHQMLEEYDSARLVLNMVKEIVYRNNDTAMRAYYLFNLGAYFTVINQPDSAKLQYLLAYDLWKAIGNESQLFRVTFNLGFYAFQKQDYKEAIKYYHLSEDAATKYGLKRDVAHVYGTMAESYAALGDYKNAYTYLYRYATLNDSFSREDINSYVLRLDKKFQSDKARQTIQAQELELKKQQNKSLIIIIVAIVILAAGAGAFAYITFRNRVRKKVDEAKGRFFANIAHEIRTPLSMIMGPVELLQSRITDEGMLQQLDMAARNSARLNDLINQMLDISKIDAAAYKLQEHAGDPGEFIVQLFPQFYEQARAKRITMACTCDINTQVYFDRDALEKILSNLAGNAIKYTPEGGNAGIDVTGHFEDDTLMLCVNVWDSGQGIPAGEQQKIFERFYRSADGAVAGTKGTGIGLALVKELVTLMNGSIVLESAPGKGAVFSVSLPLRRSVAAVPGAVKISAASPVILLAEDDKDILVFNKALLEREGYSVIATQDGAAALAAINETLPDLLVSDLMMPGMDGLTLLRELRANELTAHIPVIILSAKAAQHTRTELIGAGAQAYLPKPFSPAELTGTIKSQLDLLQRHKARYQAMVADETTVIEKRLEEADPFAQRCHALILEHIDDAQFSVERLAELMTVNRSHFQRKIKALTGYSPSELIKTTRLEKAKEMLLRKEGNITETAYATGFTSQSYFTRCFTEHFGYPPSDLNRK